MDVRLHFQEAGAGDALIMLHGNGEDHTFFEHQVPAFARSFRVIALDTRGHGASPRGRRPFTLDQFACDVHDFMDEQEVQRAHLLGFSDGGNIALLFALAHPQRVASLVLNGANLFPEGLTAEVRAEDDAAWVRAQQMGDTHTLDLLRLMRDEPHIDPAQLSALEGIPALVVAGSRDMIQEDHTRLIAQSIPGAELAILDGTHFVAAEDPDAFNRVVGDFYAAHGFGM